MILVSAGDRDLSDGLLDLHADAGVRPPAPDLQRRRVHQPVSVQVAEARDQNLCY